jgi:hypothetical protein
MKYLLMYKIFDIPVCNGVFNSREEIDTFFETYVGDPNKPWQIVEVKDSEFDEKFAMAVNGTLNI